MRRGGRWPVAIGSAGVPPVRRCGRRGCGEGEGGRGRIGPAGAPPVTGRVHGARRLVSCRVGEGGGGASALPPPSPAPPSRRLRRRLRRRTGPRRLVAVHPAHRRRRAGVLLRRLPRAAVGREPFGVEDQPAQPAGRVDSVSFAHADEREQLLGHGHAPHVLHLDVRPRHMGPLPPCRPWARKRAKVAHWAMQLLVGRRAGPWKGGGPLPSQAQPPRGGAQGLQGSAPTWAVRGRERRYRRRAGHRRAGRLRSPTAVSQGTVPGPQITTACTC